MHCRLLQQGDFAAAGQVLADVESTASGVFSPALRAHQLCLWARLRLQEVQCVAVAGSRESAVRCLQALCACEWARALAPATWRQVGDKSPPPPSFSPPTFPSMFVHFLFSSMLVLSMICMLVTLRRPTHGYRGIKLDPEWE